MEQASENAHHERQGAYDDANTQVFRRWVGYLRTLVLDILEAHYRIVKSMHAR